MILLDMNKKTDARITDKHYTLENDILTLQLNIGDYDTTDKTITATFSPSGVETGYLDAVDGVVSIPIYTGYLKEGINKVQLNFRWDADKIEQSGIMLWRAESSLTSTGADPDNVDIVTQLIAQAQAAIDTAEALKGIDTIERTAGDGSPGTLDTYTITYTDETTTTFQVRNGPIGPQGVQGDGLEFNWSGTQLGVRVEGEASYTYVDLKGEKGEPGGNVTLDDASVATDKVWSSDKISTQLADITNKNHWLRTLGNGIYVAHQGFSGYISTTTANGVYPSNTNLAFEMAGELGFKIIETDIQVLSDGTWVVLHDADTSIRLTGDAQLINDIDIVNLKTREFYKEYLSAGSYWTYTGELAGFKVMTLEEALLVCKKYGMYIMPEIKWSDYHTYTATDWQNFAEIVQKTGMEDRTIVYSSVSSWVYAAKEYLPNAIVATYVQDTTVWAEKMKSYKNFIGVTSSANYTPEREQFCKENKIPVIVWTVDSYVEAESLFKRGAKMVITNFLCSNIRTDSYGIMQREDTKSLYNKSTVTKSDGDSAIDSNNIVSFSTTGYNERYLLIPAGILKRGDIVRIKATAKANRESPSSVCRMYVHNSGTAPSKRESRIDFNKSEYETKEIYYFVADEVTATRIHFGLTSTGGITSTGNFKNIELTIFTKTDTDTADNERFAMIYNYGAIAINFRPSTVKKGITSVYVDPLDAKLLCVDYTPFRNPKGNPLVFIQMTDYSTNNKYNVIPIVDNTTNGTVKLKVFTDAWVQVNDVSANLNLSFSILIKNY